MNRIALLIMVTTLLNIGYTQQKTNSVNAEYFIYDKKGQKITPAFSFIDEFTEDGYAICAKGGNSVENRYGKIPFAKYGIIDKSGKILVPLTYDYIEEISDVDSLFIANIGETYGLIDYKGNKLTAFDYSDLSTIYDMDMVLRAKRGNTYSIIDFSGKQLTKNYQELYTTTSGLVVQDNGYEGLLDKNFKEIFPCKYDDISELDPGLFHVTDKFLKHWLLDIDGQKLSAAYDEIESTYNEDYETVGYTVSIRGKAGFIDKSGKVLIQPVYNELNQIKLTGNTFIFSYSNNDGKYGLIDAHGKKLGKAVYSSINSNSYFGKYILVGVEKKSKTKKKKNREGGLIDDEWYYNDYTPSTYGLVDANGKLITKPVYEDYVYGYSDNNLIILKKGANWVALDENLTNAFDKDFSNIEQVGDYFKVQIGGVDNGYGTPEGGVFGLIDRSGKEIIPIQYEDIQEIGYDSDNGYMVKKAGKYGICSKTGKVLFAPEYAEMNCSGDICIVSRFIEQYEQNKYGLFNHTTLKEIAPTQFDQIESLSYDGNYIFGLNNKFGLMDKNGKIILPANYNYLKATDLYDNDQWIMANAYGQVTKGYYGSEVTGGNWGIINIQGDTILPFKFKEISFENDSIVNLWDYDGKAYLYNILSNKALTNPDANYVNKIIYNWQNPIYLLGKDVIRGEYGDVSGGTYGLVTVDGKELCSFNYSEIKDAGDYFIANSTDFNGFDLLDIKGNILKKRVTSIQALSDTLFLIQNEGKASVYSPLTNYNHIEGEFTDFATPEYLNNYGSINIGVKTKGDKWGVINRQGEMLIAPQYCDIIASSDFYIIAAKCGAEGEMFKYGVIDLMNNVLIPFEYESIESTYGGNFDCIKGKTVYSVNLSNEIISKKPAPNE